MEGLQCGLTSLRFCCAANVVTASEAREPDAYRDCSNRLLGGATAADTCRASDRHHEAAIGSQGCTREIARVLGTEEKNRAGNFLGATRALLVDATL